ncbi:MAG: hypothetical protein COA32_02025 [Fluviicola sp.]|nr:MAG: hypothetical protein COA32_02025 [Fluviicola sp.]
MRLSFLFTLLFSVLICQAQEYIEHPKFPKGINSNDQYEAVPHYNEAVELYKKGEIERAKTSLLEAINTSFALVEAQLFLGEIYYEQGRIDSAMIYLNSGIDFEINQPAHYYFKLFEVGMKLELYDVLKHNLKHFKKYYGNIDYGEYDSLYPYTVNDYEFYMNSVSLATDYNYWKTRAVKVTDLQLSNKSEVIPTTKGLVISSTEDQKLIKRKGLKKNRIKMKEFTFFQSEWISNELSFRTVNENGIYKSYWKFEKDDNWVLLPKEVNNGSWNGHFFYAPKYSLIYFSSDRTGNKDLFVIKFNSVNSSFSQLSPLSRVNTKGDEIYPTFINNVFYFSSNGLPGFGGFDIYFTPDYSIENGLITPSKWYNLGKPYNTGDDEIQFMIYDDFQFVSSTNWNNQNKIVVFKPKVAHTDFDYEIKLKKIEKD